jgi:hypothetical protein
MKKAEVIKHLARLPGFKKVGMFYIGLCNNDIISGYCLDAPPQNIYIWRFILPTFDNIEFFHLTLGKRVLSVTHSRFWDGDDSIDIGQLILKDWSEFSKIKDRAGLLSYIDTEQLNSAYALWVRYITYIMNREFDRAEEIHNIPEINRMLLDFQFVSKNYTLLSKEKAESGWEGCVKLLDIWLKKMREKFC